MSQTLLVFTDYDKQVKSSIREGVVPPVGGIVKFNAEGHDQACLAEVLELVYDYTQYKGKVNVKVRLIEEPLTIPSKGNYSSILNELRSKNNLPHVKAEFVYYLLENALAVADFIVMHDGSIVTKVEGNVQDYSTDIKVKCVRDSAPLNFTFNNVINAEVKPILDSKDLELIFHTEDDIHGIIILNGNDEYVGKMKG